MKILAQVDNLIVQVDSQTDFSTVHKIEKGDLVEFDLSQGFQGDTWSLQHASKNTQRIAYQMLANYLHGLAEKINAT